MGNKWEKNSNAERHYTGKFYRPMALNLDHEVDKFNVGRIWVRIFPTGQGPIYRFRVEFKFHYPKGVSDYVPDDALRELQRAVGKARKKIRNLERIQFLPVWAKFIRHVLGF